MQCDFQILVLAIVSFTGREKAQYEKYSNKGKCNTNKVLIEMKQRYIKISFYACKINIKLGCVEEGYNMKDP